jgi:trimethylamine--corrinoid protein Co-methyltransferase
MKLASFEASLISNEIFSVAYRLLQGVDCSRDAIGIDAFKEVGHESRFLETMHAVKYVRSSERRELKLTDRNCWNTWQDRTGGMDMAQRANKTARQILSQHNPEYITSAQAREIDKIAGSAQKWFIDNWNKLDIV